MFCVIMFYVKSSDHNRKLWRKIMNIELEELTHKNVALVNRIDRSDIMGN